jgi:hypothetical protein
MAHYAVLDENNIVVNVITGKNEDELLDGKPVNWEDFYSNELGMTVKRTSYNTFGGVHTKGSKPFRKNYAVIDGHYDPDGDAFYAPQPFPSWVLDGVACLWVPPVPRPDGPEIYLWSEADQEWITPPTV